MNFTLDWARSGRTLVLDKAASIGVEIILALFCLEDGPDTVLLQSSWQTLHANNSEYFISLTWCRPTNPTMQHMLNVVITEKIGNLKNMFIFVALCSTNCPKLPMLHALDIIIRDLDKVLLLNVVFTKFVLISSAVPRAAVSAAQPLTTTKGKMLKLG